MLRIWGRETSLNVQKVLWCCDELNLTFERIDVGGQFGGLDTPAYRAINPNGLIPAMEDDGMVLWEANVIVRFLAAKYGTGSLCPAALGARLQAERWMDWQLCHILPGMITLFFGLIRTPPEKRDNAAIEAARVATEHWWLILDEYLRDRLYLGGDVLTIADIPLGTTAYRWLMLPIARPPVPHLRAWFSRLSTRLPYQRRVMLPLR